MMTWFSRVCRAFLVPAILVLSAVAPAGAYQTAFLQRQPEQVVNGRVTVLAATIFTLTCGNPNTTNENGAQYYLYEYVDAYGKTRTDIAPYRVISPPNWGQPIGGHDWANWQQAAAYACQKGVRAPMNPGSTNTGPVSTSNISGTWQLTSNCKWTDSEWKSTLMINQGANGALTGTLPNDALKASFATAETNWGSKVQNLYSPPTMTLVLHPSGWVSVLELTGTLSGSTISGKVHHYTNDDCTFSMTRA